MTATPAPPSAREAPTAQRRPGRPRPVLRIAAYAVRRRRFAPLAWGLPLSLMSAFVVAVYPSIEDSSEFGDVIESYPEALKEAFGVSAASFQTIQGYMAAEVFSLIGPLVACYFLIHALADAVCGSEQRRSLDVLLSAPLRRRQLVAGWLLGNVAVLLGILALFWALTWLSAVVFGVDLPAADAAAGTLGLVPLAVFFGGVTLVLAGVSHRAALVAGAAAGTLLAMYLVEVLGTFSDAVEVIRPLSAFHYYGSAIEDGIEIAPSAGLLVVGSALAVLGAALFERRDIR